MSINDEAAGLAAYTLVTSLLDHLTSSHRIRPDECDEVLKEALLRIDALTSSTSPATAQRARLFLQARLNASVTPSEIQH